MTLKIEQQKATIVLKSYQQTGNTHSHRHIRTSTHTCIRCQMCMMQVDQQTGREAILKVAQLRNIMEISHIRILSNMQTFGAI